MNIPADRLTEVYADAAAWVAGRIRDDLVAAANAAGEPEIEDPDTGETLAELTQSLEPEDRIRGLQLARGAVASALAPNRGRLGFLWMMFDDDPRIRHEATEGLAWSLRRG